MLASAVPRCAVLFDAQVTMKQSLACHGVQVRPTAWCRASAAAAVCVVDPTVLPLPAGFTGDFWRAYHEVIPKAPGFDRRKDLYLLYHYLNHTNLFGGEQGCVASIVESAGRL